MLSLLARFAAFTFAAERPRSARSRSAADRAARCAGAATSAAAFHEAASFAIAWLRRARCTWSCRIDLRGKAANVYSGRAIEVDARRSRKCCAPSGTQTTWNGGPTSFGPNRQKPGPCLASSSAALRSLWLSSHLVNSTMPMRCLCVYTHTCGCRTQRSGDTHTSEHMLRGSCGAAAHARGGWCRCLRASLRAPSAHEVGVALHCQDLIESGHGDGACLMHP